MGEGGLAGEEVEEGGDEEGLVRGEGDGGGGVGGDVFDGAGMRRGKGGGG